MNDKELINYEDPKVIQTLKDTVALGATDAEFAMFAGLCKSTGLNPFKREVWFIKTKGYTKKDGTEVKPRVQIMTGYNGFLAIANSHPQFDGMECEILRDKDNYIINAIAKVYRKDRKYPAIAEARWDEYYVPNPYGNKGIWDQKGSVMIAKCAKSLALREAFPQELNGLYTEEEIPKEYSPPLIETKKPQKPQEKEPFYYEILDATKEQVDYLDSQGAWWDEALGYWASTKRLDKKLDKHLVAPGEKRNTLAYSKSNSIQLTPADELPNWDEQEEQDKHMAAIKEETPLEKVKKRAAKMVEDSKGKLELDEIVGKVNL